MPDAQETVLQETPWESLATESHLGLTHVQSQWVQTVWVKAPEGLHLRKCAAIAELVSQFQARVTLQQGDRSEDAASVLGLMLLAATQGTSLTLSATGPEAEEAFRAVVQLFGEDGEVSQVIRRSWHPRAPR